MAAAEDSQIDQSTMQLVGTTAEICVESRKPFSCVDEVRLTFRERELAIANFLQDGKLAWHVTLPHTRHAYPCLGSTRAVVNAENGGFENRMGGGGAFGDYCLGRCSLTRLSAHASTSCRGRDNDHSEADRESAPDV
jgi:hypothetical protein